MIQVEHLSKSFGKIRAVRDLSFIVAPGEILGLLGPNGAGKTTSMRILAGFFPPTTGRVLVNGTDLHRSPRRFRQQIGYLPENVPLYNDLITDDFLTYVAQLKNVDRHQRTKAIQEVIDRCDLGSVRHRLIGKLSKGFKQRVGLAQALLGNPSFLILDEPTGGLDPKQILKIRSLIKDLSKERTVILSTHILPEVSMLCSRVLIIHEGSLVASGTPDELAARLRHSSELVVSVRGEPTHLQESFQKLQGIIAVRLEKSNHEEHEFRILYKKEKDLRPVLARSVIDSGLELLGLRQVSMTLEEIFLKIVVQEEGVKASV